MSSINNNTKYTNNKSGSSNRPVYKSFCKVCQDAGKPESIYTNHNVRQSQDKNSPVTCPTLLAQECRVCYKRGHSSKYCPLNQGQNQGQSQPLAAALVKKPTFQPRTTVLVRQAPKNVFMVFDEEDAKDELEEENKRIIEAKEALLRKVAPAPVKPSATANVFSFAKIIAAAPALNHTDALRKAFAEAAKDKSKANKAKAVLAADNQKPKFSWADCDSGSDCDEEEETETETSAW